MTGLGGVVYSPKKFFPSLPPHRSPHRCHIMQRGRAEPYLPDDVVAAEPVLIHDGDDNGGLPQHMGGHVEGEGLVEDGVQTALHGHRLLLLHALVLVHQPHLHIRICNVGAKAEHGMSRARQLLGVGFAIALLIVKVRGK